MLWSLLWQDQAVLREISRPHGARLLTSFESRQYMPVIKATSTRTSKNNIQWWKILPSSDKEITPLKSSWSLGYNLRKRIVLQRRIVLVLLTAVDLRQTIMYAAWPDNISLQSTSLPPKGFQRVPLVSITIFISSSLHFFFFQIQVVRRSLSLLIKMIYKHVLRDKKKEPALFWSANFPRLPRHLTYIF